MKKGMRWTIVLAGVFVLGLAGLAGGAPPSFHGIGDLTGSYVYSIANRVSADGSTVVGSSNSTAGPTAVKWTAQGGLVPLGDLSGGNYASFAYDVSGDGSVIVGGSSSARCLYEEAFIWTSQTGMQPLLPAQWSGWSSDAYAITSDGSVIVGDARPGDNSQAMQCTPQGQLTYLQPRAYWSQAAAVSADGSVIVGRTYEYAQADRPVLWRAQGGMEELGHLPGAITSGEARDVSADGSVVVGITRAAGDGGHTEAFRWTQGTGMVGLGRSSSTHSSWANAVSADGSVIVGTDWIDGVYTAAIWRNGGGPEALKDVLQNEYGFNLAGWQLEQAQDISANGGVIVGSALNPAGFNEGFVVVLPEPATLFVLAAGGLAVLRRRRKS